MDCTADCRIFQTMTYPAIIKAILDEYGVTDYDFKLLKSDYPTVDYCVQYRESALAFISRLMEHVGIFFFHEHTADDAPADHHRCQQLHQVHSATPAAQTNGAVRPW